MPPRAARKPINKDNARNECDVAAILTALRRLGSKRMRDQMSARFGITGATAATALGVPMTEIRKVAKRLGRNHELAQQLWETGAYDARTLAAFVAEPQRVTPAMMDRWCRAFDNWAICDTACFHLFDRTPHAHAKIRQWARRKDEFVRRAAFALLASVALHDKTADDQLFIAALPLIESAAGDERNFVKKAVSWALRGIGKRNAALQVAATRVASRLAESREPAARWVGKDALREFTRRSLKN